MSVLLGGRGQRAVRTVAKQSLPSLYFVFHAFLKARLVLRKEALKGFDLESFHGMVLSKSTPFFIDLFGKEAVEVTARVESFEHQHGDHPQEDFQTSELGQASRGQEAVDFWPSIHHVISSSEQPWIDLRPWEPRRFAQGSSRDIGSGSGQSQTQNPGKTGSIII